MDITVVTKQMGDIITWYAKTKTPNPEELLHQMKRLVGYSWYFADFVAEAKGEYNEKYFVRKIAVEREKQNLIKSGLAVNKAESEALLFVEDQFQLELESEAVAYRADVLLKQCNKVLDAMRSEFSYLKSEKATTYEQV